ncbi:MAG: hypothetical protein M3Q14_02295 [bacterium]|nr:hypothetical protein [bacterium]
MTKKKQKRSSTTAVPQFTLRRGKRTVSFIADKVLIFRLMRNLHGRSELSKLLYKIV